MAMIRCPECGKEISSNATHCVGCGCEITYCPDCGKVAVGKPETCSVCGHVFRRDAKDSVEKEIVTIEKIQKKDEKAFKLSQNLLSLFIVAAAVLVVVGMLLLKSWSKKEDSLEQLTSMKSAYNGILACYVLIIILVAMAIIGICVSNFSLTIWHSSWMKRKKFDYRDYFRGLGSGQKTDMHMQLFQQRMTNAAYMIHREMGYLFDVVRLSLISALAIIFCIAGSICAKEIIQSYFTAAMLSEKFKFSASSAFYVTLVSYVSVAIAAVVFRKIDKNRMPRLQQEMLQG